MTIANFVLSDYVEEIFYTFMNASREELANAAAKLREMTPAAMNTMLEEQSREGTFKTKRKEVKWW